MKFYIAGFEGQTSGPLACLVAHGFGQAAAQAIMDKSALSGSATVFASLSADRALVVTWDGASWYCWRAITSQLYDDEDEAQADADAAARETGVRCAVFCCHEPGALPNSSTLQ